MSRENAGVQRVLSRAAAALALGALALLAGAGCSDAGPESEPSDTASEPGASTDRGNGASGGASNGLTGVTGYNRPAGMAIGQGASRGDAEDGATGGTDSAPVDIIDEESPADLEIPDFELPPPDPPPCSGCVELNADVNDINQRDDFVFSAGGVAVTRIVWNLIIPFNSDQLFVQPFVDSAYGTYTDLDANAFPVDTPVQLIHTFSGTANTVGLAIGSAGAWTGNQTMSVFVDSVTLEGADPAASRTFNVSADGFATRTAANNPRVVHHP